MFVAMWWVGEGLLFFLVLNGSDSVDGMTPSSQRKATKTPKPLLFEKFYILNVVCVLLNDS